ncbi:prolyl oligopeptidase family serine peptidase [Microbacterium sp.]|uniref:S9 family peptidase n=1 Tax=Microbacterium sp. TaxID=51671 RepID=UPI0025CD584B|nr:prolyl oligopeptidase family serine peptidase [Microbacterium sp.]MBT9606571.1 S9 family peptidase [Microbacterium sp.]
MPSTLPYGSWPSPLSPERVAQSSPRIDGARIVGDEIWWGESVPSEGGRVAVRRRRADGAVETVLPAPANARSSVHEYGGGAWTASDDGELYYVEKTDQRVYALAPGGEPRPLTPASDGVRHSGLSWQHGSLLAVREVHGEGRVPARAIVRIPLDGSEAEILAEGSDFLVHPALSPDGRRLAWTAWNHPDMPWDATTVRVRDLATGTVRELAGGARRAPLQPVWMADDELLYTDDPDGRWNLFRLRIGEDPQAVAPADADTGGGVWVLGTRWFGATPDGRIVAVRTDGADEVVEIAPSGVRPLDVPVCAGASIDDVRGSRALVSGSDATGLAGLWVIDLDSGDAELVTGGDHPGVEWMPVARALTAEGPHGPVHAFAYAPTSPDHVGPSDERPPYVVLVHGGPTSHVGPSPSVKTAFFTSRGIGVLDVNYGGSTGYGRAYRERLHGQWGVVDVDDVAAAASALADAGLADPARLAIAGGSAGGWTVLAAVTNTEVFSAGISRYGVGDARALAEDTHDFEARYLDGLIGALPEAEAVYIERSPLSHPERFRVPLLILQGTEDRVVPPSQAEAIRDALVEHGVAHAYVLYEGEGHGFRRAETVVDSLQRELGFLGAVFGFETPGIPALALD